MGKMVPRNAGQVHFGVDKGFVWPLVDFDLVVHKYLNVLSFLGILLFEVLGKLPDKIGIAFHSPFLFVGQIFIKVDDGGVLTLGVHYFVGDSARSAAKHHPPAQSMALLCPKYVIWEQMVPKRQQQLNEEIDAQHRKNDVLAFGDYDFGVRYEFFGFQKEISNGLWFKKEDRKGQREVGEYPDLEHNTVEQMENDGKYKSNFARRFPK